MQLGYVVLYVEDAQACADFWQSTGAKVLESNQVGEHSIIKIGFASGAALELVPKALMKDNPDNLDLATPSICFYVSDAANEHARLEALGLKAAPVRDHFGKRSFAFEDNEGRWFAVMESAN